MTRFVVVLAICAAGAAASAVACGGNDKPPLTPDSTDVQNPDATEAGAPSTAPSAPPAK